MAFDPFLFFLDRNVCVESSLPVEKGALGFKVWGRGSKVEGRGFTISGLRSRISMYTV